MSTSITVHCDVGDRDSVCASRDVFRTYEVEAARLLAAREGWTRTPSGSGDICPEHSRSQR